MNERIVFMSRKTSEELNALMKSENVSRLWSYSRISCFDTSPYEYFLKYVVKKKEDRTDCIYASLGGAAHQCLEDYYTNKIQYEEMKQQFEDCWLTNFDLAGLKFDRNDEKKNMSIAEKYHKDLVHFFNNHKTIEYKTFIEDFIKIKIGNHILIGYIDCYFVDSDGYYNIIDFKSSSEYKNRTLEEHSAQLTLYGIGLMQLGVPKDKIKIGFNFLKYCNVEVMQKNGKIKNRSIERYCLGESLSASAKMWLKAEGYDDSAVEHYIELLVATNGIECLPKEVQEKFNISDRYVYIDFNDLLIAKWTDKTIRSIRDIMLREMDYEKNRSDKCFWDKDERVKEESYYFSTLCGYSPNLHKPYGEYLRRLEAVANGEDTFNGIGNEDDQYNNITQSVQTTKSTDNNSEVDLSWLDDLD